VSELSVLPLPKSTRGPGFAADDRHASIAMSGRVGVELKKIPPNQFSPDLPLRVSLTR
jgi:hypothetical protein